jgi:hypothetical protein
MSCHLSGIICLQDTRYGTSGDLSGSLDWCVRNPYVSRKNAHQYQSDIKNVAIFGPIGIGTMPAIDRALACVTTVRYLANPGYPLFTNSSQHWFHKFPNTHLQL